MHLSPTNGKSCWLGKQYKWRVFDKSENVQYAKCISQWDTIYSILWIASGQEEGVFEMLLHSHFLQKGLKKKKRNTHCVWLEAQKRKKYFQKCVQHDLLIWAPNPFSPVTFLELFSSFFAENNQRTTLFIAAHRNEPTCAELPPHLHGASQHFHRTTWFPSS